jgi:hypothetical protein
MAEVGPLGTNKRNRRFESGPLRQAVSQITKLSGSNVKIPTCARFYAVSRLPENQCSHRLRALLPKISPCAEGSVTFGADRDSPPVLSGSVS